MCFKCSPWNLNRVFKCRMACAAIPGLSTSSEEPVPQPRSKFAPARKYVEPLKGQAINNVSGFMSCHLELNYAEVSKLIFYYVLMAVNVHVCINGGHA